MGCMVVGLVGGCRRMDLHFEELPLVTVVGPVVEFATGMKFCFADC